MKRAVIIGLLALYFVACAEKSVNSGPETAVQRTVYEFTVTAADWVDSAKVSLAVPEITFVDMPVVQVYYQGEHSWSLLRHYYLSEGQVCIVFYGIEGRFRVVVIR